MIVKQNQQFNLNSYTVMNQLVLNKRAKNIYKRNNLKQAYLKIVVNLNVMLFWSL